MPIETCIDEAARMGFDGVDILLMQMDRQDNGYLQQLKRRALINGLDLCCMSTHQGFVYPSKEKRQENVENHPRHLPVRAYDSHVGASPDGPQVGPHVSLHHDNTHFIASVIAVG